MMMRLPRQFVGSIHVRISNFCSQLNGASSPFSCCRYSDVPSNKDPMQVLHGGCFVVQEYGFYSGVCWSSAKPAAARRITSAEYNARRKDFRSAEVHDAETGHKPTSFQRFFMVAVLLYKNMASIPEYVGKGTMARYNDRMRILKMFIAMAVAFIIAYSFEIDANLLPLSLHQYALCCKALSVVVGLRAAYVAGSCQSNEDDKKNWVKDADHSNSAKANHTHQHSVSVNEVHDEDDKFTMMDNPGVLFGVGVTILALVGACYKLAIGDRSGLQSMLRYRVYAQSFTIAAIIGGAVYMQIKKDMRNSKT